MPLKVLVIDRDAAEATLVHHALGAEGYEVATATTLDEGLSIFRDGGVDLLLISNDTPADAVSTWWSEARGTLGQVPIILLGEDNQLLPVVDAIATPIDTTRLVDAVRTQLEPLSPQPANAWLPESLREESAEIAEMERLLGWGGGPATEDADPVSLGIFSHDEALAAPAPAPAPEAPEAVDALELPEAPAHGPEPAGDALEAVDALQPIDGEAPDTRAPFASLDLDGIALDGLDPAGPAHAAPEDVDMDTPDEQAPDAVAMHAHAIDAEAEELLARQVASDLDAAFAAFTEDTAEPPRAADADAAAADMTGPAVSDTVLATPTGDTPEPAEPALAGAAGDAAEPLAEAVAEAAHQGATDDAGADAERAEADELGDLVASLRGFLDAELADVALEAAGIAPQPAEPEADTEAAEPELVLDPAVDLHRDPLAAAGVADGQVPLNAEAPPAPRLDPTPPPVSRAVVHANELPRDIAGLPIEKVERIVAQVAREVVEQVVWETVPLMVARVLSEKQAHQDKLFTQIVERAVWESLPALAESRIQAEIHRLTDT